MEFALKAAIVAYRYCDWTRRRLHHTEVFGQQIRPLHIGCFMRLGNRVVVLAGDLGYQAYLGVSAIDEPVQVQRWFAMRGERRVCQQGVECISATGHEHVVRDRVGVGFILC